MPRDGIQKNDAGDDETESAPPGPRQLLQGLHLQLLSRWLMK